MRQPRQRLPHRLHLGNAPLQVGDMGQCDAFDVGADAAMHKLVHLVYVVLKTRKPFDVNCAEEAVQTSALVVGPPKNTVFALDFQDGIHNFMADCRAADVNDC
jgi:hypothetical protein